MGWKRRYSEFSGSVDTMFDTQYQVLPIMNASGTVYFMLNPDVTQNTKITHVRVVANVQTSGTFILKDVNGTTISPFSTGSILVGTVYNGVLTGTNTTFSGSNIFSVNPGATTGSYNIFVCYKNLK